MTHDGLLALLDAGLKATVLLAAVQGLALALRKSGGRALHLLWTTGFLGILALGVLSLPVLDNLVPAWRLTWLPVPAPPAASADPLLSTIAGAPAEGFPADSGPRVSSATLPPFGGVPVHERRAAAALERPRRAPPMPWWAAAWALGTVLVLTHCGSGFLRAARVARRARRLGGERWSAALDEAKATVGVRRAVLLQASAEISTPMTCGWRRPRILLPAEAGSWSDECLRLVLIHELVHVRRGDWIVHLLAQLASAIYWPSPLVWPARRRLTDAREQACDERVLALGAKPSDYASHLLDIAQTLSDRRRTPADALAMIHRSQLEGRLMSILSPEPSRRGSRPLATLIACLVATLIVSLATVELWAEARENEDPGGESATEHGRSGEWTMQSTFDDGLHVSMRSSGGRLGAGGGLELEPGATVVLETSRIGSRQRLEITQAGGERRFAWSIDNLEAPFDARGRQWMDTVVAILADLQKKGELRGRAGALRGRMGALRGQEGALRGQIGALRGQEGALRGQIGALKGQIGSLRGQIGQLRGQEGALRGQIGALRGQIAGLRQQRMALARLERGDAEIVEIDEQVAGHEEEIRLLEEQLAGFDLEAQVAQVESRMADVDVEAEIAELEQRIAELAVGERAAEIERQIVELETGDKLAELEHQIGALRVDENVAAIDADLDARAAELHRILDELGC